MLAGQVIGVNNPGGASGSIAAALGAVAAGDLVAVLYGWKTSGLANPFLGVTGDTSPGGQAWTTHGMNANGGGAGGLAYCIADEAWSAITATAALTSGTPGGRVYAAFRVPAALVAGAPTFVAGPQQVTATPSVASGALAAAISAVFALDLQGDTSGQTAAMTWGGGFAPVAGIAGSGSPQSGVFIGELDVTGAGPVTATGSSNDANDNHQLDLMIVPLTSLPAAPSGGTVHVPVRHRSGVLADVGELRVGV